VALRPFAASLLKRLGIAANISFGVVGAVSAIKEKLLVVGAAYAAFFPPYKRSVECVSILSEPND
jgi:hypothetical protein